MGNNRSKDTLFLGECLILPHTHLDTLVIIRVHLCPLCAFLISHRIHRTHGKKRTSCYSVLSVLSVCPIPLRIAQINRIIYSVAPKNSINPCKSVELDNSQIRDKKDTGPDGLFWLRLFPTPKSWSLFLFLKGVAHRRCAHRISASQLGELVLIEDRH